MKKRLIILVLFSFLLVGCSHSTKKFVMKDAFPKKFTELMTPKVSMSHKTLNYDVEISQMNEFVIVFNDFSIYHVELEEFLQFDKTTTNFINLNGQYLLINNTNEYLVFSYKTGKKLLTLEKGLTFDFQFNYNEIIVRELIEGSYQEKEKYYFKDYDLLEEVQEEDLLISPNLNKVKKYEYMSNSEGITLFKDGKFYTYYQFEENMKSWYFLENGNILTLYIKELPNDSKEYDFIDGVKKCKYKYVLYEISKKREKVVELNIIIGFLMPKNDQFPIGWDNVIGYKKIDKETKVLDEKSSNGGISNNLKTITPLEFDFGMPRDVTIIDGGLFALEMEYGIFLINGKNKIVNQLIFDVDSYGVDILRNATVMLTINGKTIIYNLKKGESLKKDIEIIDSLNLDTYILKDNDKYYVFNGEFTEYDKEVSKVNDMFYKVEGTTYFNYHFIDGNKIFNTDQSVNYNSSYGGTYTLYVFSYPKGGAIVHEIVKVVVEGGIPT